MLFRVFKDAFLLVLSFLMISCDKNEDISELKLRIDHRVDGEILELETDLYQNTAGNNYKVLNLKYYISDIKLWRNDILVKEIEDIHYVDASLMGEYTLVFPNLDPGDYTGISYLIGLSEENNVSGGLENTIANNNMQWPDILGGGYHFLKFEGYFYPENSDQQGYAVHLGTSIGLVEGELHSDIQIKEGETMINLAFELNNLFDNPYDYDLSIDGSHTMGDSVLMSKIAQNGRDVLEILE